MCRSKQAALDERLLLLFLYRQSRKKKESYLAGCLHTFEENPACRSGDGTARIYNVSLFSCLPVGSPACAILNHFHHLAKGTPERDAGLSLSPGKEHDLREAVRALPAL
jgi:hypothetical protein